MTVSNLKGQSHRIGVEELFLSLRGVGNLRKVRSEAGSLCLRGGLQACIRFISDGKRMIQSALPQQIDSLRSRFRIQLRCGEQGKIEKRMDWTGGGEGS